MARWPAGRGDLGRQAGARGDAAAGVFVRRRGGLERGRHDRLDDRRVTVVRCAVDVASGFAADARACAAEAAAAVRAQLAGAPPDIAFVFVSAEHAADADQVASEMRRALDPGVLVGASTEA